jgi:MFS transporter, SP family, xylose:H+ symportor
MRENNSGSISFVTGVTLVAALGGLLFGYDTAVISGAIGFLQTHFELSAAMKGWAASSALGGCIIGVLAAGFLSDKFGRRTTLILSAVMFLISAIGTAVPEQLSTFIVFRIIGGVGVGAASMTSPMYIAEITPARIRGRMVSLNQFAIVTGMLVVYFVNYYIEGAGDFQWNVETGWRWMFGSESIPALILLITLLFVPETPRWLYENNRKEKAREILTKVDGAQNAEREISQIEKLINIEPVSYRELFAASLRPVLVIGVFLAVFQQITGINVFLYYAPEIFKSIAGSSMDAALLQTIVVGAVNLGSTILAIWLVDKAGRKPLMIIGSFGMGISLLAMGVASWFDQMGSWLLLVMLVYIAAFALSLGPVVWVILSEIFPTRIRGRALGFATLCLWTANLIVSQTFPMMDENPWLVDKFNHGFPFLLYSLFCVILLVFVIFKVPETKGRSLEDIQSIWLNKTDKKDIKDEFKR